MGQIKMKSLNLRIDKLKTQTVMKKQLFAIGIALLVAGCARQPEYECKFTLNGETHLTFNFTNVKTPQTFYFLYNQSFPLDQFKKTFRVESDTTIEYTLSLNHPAEAPCWCDSIEFIMFLIQNETLTVNIDLANSNVTFEGFTKQICEHLTNNPTILAEDFENDESYFAKIDSAYADKQKSLDSAYSVGLLPQWFRDYQTENLSFHKVFLKQGCAYDDLNKMDILRKCEPIRESKYYWIDDYTNFLCMFSAPRFDTLLGYGVSNEVFYEYVQDNINNVKSKLPEDISSYFTAARLSNYLIFLQKAHNQSEYNEKNKYLNRLIEANSSLIKDTALLNYVTTEQANTYNELLAKKMLKKGDKAPNFYLKNLDNESVSLSNFADKLVLLNFWNTHCEGCIARTPQKNALVEKYGKQGFELVNICLEDAPEACQQIVKENNALGSHLICKGKWAQNLSDSYWITSVAHYTLIDRNGLIIKNRIESDSLEYYIEKYISVK